MSIKLLIGLEVDDLLRLPRGRSERLARRGKLPCVKLPSGDIRFREGDIHRIIAGESSSLLPAGGKAVVDAR
jgi:predicted site-specific integrase-resolvase